MPKKAIDVVIKGEYTDRDINRAIRDLERLKTQGSGLTSSFGTMTGQVNGFMKSFTAGFIGMGASLGGFVALQSAVRLFGDSVKAAMEDEAAMRSLAKAMENVGQAAATPQVEAFVDSLQRATGVADDQLRPAFQKLVTVTQDATESQRLLKLAMDISAGTGKDLESVSMALAKAASGQTTALQRLGVGLDTATLKSKDMDLITSELSRKFEGQAATAANTYEGQLNRLKVGFSELQEAMGYGFLNALGASQDGTDGLMQSMKQLEPIAAFFGRQIGENVRGLSSIVRGATAAKDAFDRLGKQMGLGNSIFSEFITLTLRSPLGWLAIGVDKLTAKLRIGTNAWADYYDAAAGPSDFDAGMFGGGTFGGSTTAGGRDWSQFYKVNPSSQRALAEARTGGEKLRKAYFDGLNDLGGGGGGGGGSASKPLSKFQQDAQELLGTITGLGREIGSSTADTGKATFDKINSQVEQFKSTFAEAKSFAQGIVSTFMAELDLGAALDQAKAAGTSIVEEFANQGKKAEAFGKRMNEMLAAGLSKTALQDILKLGFDRGMDVMNALADGNVQANVENVNKVYRSVESLATSVADQARSVFYDSGMQSMVTTLKGMIDELMPEGKTRKRLMAMMDNLAASLNRTSTITVATVYSGGPPPSLSPVPGDLAAAMAGYSGPVFTSPVDFSSFGAGVQMFADGGIATSPTLGIFGEAGPEALIPLDRMGSVSGGNTYNFNISTGVGDPRQIGEQVVSYIKRFEAASGPVFARA
jgi:hypothetical protein